MEHVAVFSQTRYGPAGWVASGMWAVHALDAAPRSHRAKDGIGIVGYQGCASFTEAVDCALAWERAQQARQGGSGRADAEGHSLTAP